jgi:hypothetical protein
MFPQVAQVRGHACRSPNGVPQKEQWEFLIVIVNRLAFSTAELSCAAVETLAKGWAAEPEALTFL